MIGRLGPRRLAYVTSAGVQGELEVTIEGTGLKRVDLGDGVVVDRPSAKVRIISDWLNKEMHADGEDELQTIFYLLRISDIYIQQVCREQGASVQIYAQGELISDFGVYR